MTDKMTLVFVKKTGHVLAFVTRESDAETKLTPDVLAGEALLVRYAGDPGDGGFDLAQFLVPPEALDVEIKDFDELVVTRPRDFSLNAAKQIVNANGAPPSANPTGNDQITVALGANVTEKTPVWIQVAGVDPTKTQVREADINLNTLSVAIDLLPLDAGDYFVLALVAGRRMFVNDFTIP